jgi:hypothetical protein
MTAADASEFASAGHARQRLCELLAALHERSEPRSILIAAAWIPPPRGCSPEVRCCDAPPVRLLVLGLTQAPGKAFGQALTLECLNDKIDEGARLRRQQRAARVVDGDRPTVAIPLGYEAHERTAFQMR